MTNRETRPGAPSSEPDPAELARRSARLEYRVETIEQILTFAATRLAGILLLLGILLPLVVIEQDGEQSTESLLTVPFALFGELSTSEDGGDEWIGYFIGIGFAGLLVVAALCCLGLLLFPGSVAIWLRVATWLLLVGTGIGAAIVLYFSGLSASSEDETWGSGPGLWVLMAGVVLTAALLLSEDRRRWLSGNP